MNDSKEEKVSGCSNKREATIALKNKTHRQASELNRLNCQYKHAKEELIRLKELNREMVEVITMVYKNYHNDMSIYDLTQVHDAIAKAKGREPIIKEES